MRRTFAALTTALATFVIAAAPAAAKTVTITKAFALKPNATTTYLLPFRTSIADSGYILAGSNFSIREDNLVDPYPRQPFDRGQISRGGAKIIAVGTVTAGFQVRVKTGKLSGTVKLTLYVKKQT